MSDTAKGTVTIARLLEIILAGLISAGMSGLLFAVLGIFKAPQAVLIGVGVSVAYAYLTRNQYAAARPTIGVPYWQVLALLLIAIFFRWSPVNYVSGGQDQGVYVNIAAHIVHSGGISVNDEVLEKLQDSNAAKIYAEDNSPVSGDFLLGIFHRETPSGSELQFQFYHLFPVFMALAGGIMGLDASVVALTLLSVLSVLFFYLLALSLSDRPRLAFAAALLLAINPLHAFFSRFPVSEVAALCFTLAASWLLVRAWRNSGESDAVAGGWWDILLSVGALTCAFLIRMSGFMYLPIIFIIGVAACLYEKKRSARRLVLAWVILANAAYAATVIYGYKYSPIYAGFQLDYAFKKYFGEHWGFWISLLWILSLAGLVLLYLASQKSRGTIRLRWFMDIGQRSIGPLVVVAMAIWLYKLYFLGWTDRYAADPWLGGRWHIAEAGMGVFRFSSIAVVAQYCAPFVLLLFVWLTWHRRLPGALVVLSAFVLMFLYYLVVLQWIIPYQPYYARYLVSEFVPYLILFVVLAIPHISSLLLRRTAVISLVLGGAYSALLCIGQLRANEQYGMDESYARMASWVGSGDLLLLDTETLSLPYQLIEMPFMLRYDKHVARITQNSLQNASYLRGLQGRFDQLYLLSGNPTPPQGFSPVDGVLFQEWVAEQGSHPAIKSAIRNRGFVYLHVRRATTLSPNEWLKVGELGGGAWRAFFVNGWSTPEPWGVWSDGKQARIEIPATLGAGVNPIRLKLEVQPFTTARYPKQHVRAKIGEKVVFEGDLTRTGVIDIPLDGADLPGSGTYVVEFDLPDATRPSEADHKSADSRYLALGLLSVRLETTTGDKVRIPSQ